MHMHQKIRNGLIIVLVGVATILSACAKKAEDQKLAAPATAAAKFDPHDFSGTWDRYPLPTSEQQVALGNYPKPPGVPPPPLKPEFKAKYDAEQKRLTDATARGQPIASGYTQCLPDGMPAMMMAMFPMEVLQTPRQVMIIQEAFNQVRRIYLNDTLPAVDDAEPGFWGHSVGRWEADTFVVDTIGIKDIVRFRNVPHSAGMTINERIRVLDADHFQNEVTITDAEYLTEPWKWTWVYQRRPNYKMFEYVCEDNREYADPVTGVARLRIDKN
jgi:hypothetical protein